MADKSLPEGIYPKKKHTQTDGVWMRVIRCRGRRPRRRPGASAAWRPGGLGMTSSLAVENMDVPVNGSPWQWDGCTIVASILGCMIHSTIDLTSSPCAQVDG